MCGFTRFIWVFAAVAVAAICIAAVEGRAHGRSVSLRQADANASASDNSTTNSSSSTPLEDISSSVADNVAAFNNATNLSIKNSQDSLSAFIQNPTNLSNIVSAQIQTALDINKSLIDRLNANTAKFFKALFG